MLLAVPLFAATPGLLAFTFSCCLRSRLQYQNSSLTAEVPQLLGDVDLLLSWATQAFGGRGTRGL